jgi:NADH:ubiquinone oxidoreductase subunit F (NADH-binding)
MDPDTTARTARREHGRRKAALVTAAAAVLTAAAAGATGFGLPSSAAGGEAEPVQAVLTGGYGGTWAADLDAGASRGIPAVYALPVSACGPACTAGTPAFLTAESARQCGPCTFGLPAIAADFAELVRGGGATGRLARRLPLLTGRGACAHPDGAARLADSALRPTKE